MVLLLVFSFLQRRFHFGRIDYMRTAFAYLIRLSRVVEGDVVRQVLTVTNTGRERGINAECGNVSER